MAPSRFRPTTLAGLSCLLAAFRRDSAPKMVPPGARRPGRAQDQAVALLSERRRLLDESAPLASRRRDQVSWYSGPSPPSGSVSRPPLAVIAPHWTQLEAVTWTSTSAAPLSSWS